MADTHTENSTSKTSKKRSKQQWRLRTKQLFLTYPQCPVTPETALALLQARIPQLSEWIIAQETHQDGGKHLHAWLKCTTPYETCNPKELDLEQHHGNYQAARSPKAVATYVVKDGLYVTNLDASALEKLLGSIKSVSEVWSEARTIAKDAGWRAAEEILEKNPKTCRDLCLYGDRLAKNLNGLKRRRIVVSYQLASFGWTIAWDPTTKTLILHGLTNTGKTALAKALLPRALMTSHLDLLREFDAEEYDGIILDDMSFKHLHREAQLALVDRYEDRQIHIRYTIANIPAGTPLIITTNASPDDVVSIYDAAIRRRLTIVRVLAVGNYKEE